MMAFAIDSVTPNLPAYTYVVESTNESATFSFGTAGSLHGNRVANIAANYSVTFNNGNFTVGSPTLGASPSFPITPAAISVSNYSDAEATLSMRYADGYNLAATNYNSTFTKVLYAVDVYNTINQPDFCLVFGTQIELANGTMINVEDLNVGDEIKAWVPAGLPDETQDPESDQIDWRFYHSELLSGSAQNVTVSDLTFNFAEGYFSLNNGLIKATETHPLYVWDNEIGKYKFKNVGDILLGDRIIKYTEENGEEEIEVVNIEIVNLVSEIVTINVESADVYISNGFISHNKIGVSNTQPSIPAPGLRMYLDPTKAASFPGGTLPSTGTPTNDWLDLSGWGTGVRPGAQSPLVRSGGNPSYNNNATRRERYYTFNGSSTLFYKDTTSNISGGITQFNTSAYSVIAWVRFASHPANTWNQFFGKQNVSGTREIALYLNSNGSGTYFLHDGTAVGYSSSTFSLSTNIWYMVAYTAALNGTNVGYLDGTSRGTIANGSKDYTTSALIQIGGQHAESGNFFNGQIGPVLFYNRQLSATDITNVYNHFSPSYK